MPGTPVSAAPDDLAGTFVIGTDHLCVERSVLEHTRQPIGDIIGRIETPGNVLEGATAAPTEGPTPTPGQ